MALGWRGILAFRWRTRVIGVTLAAGTAGALVTSMAQAGPAPDRTWQARPGAPVLPARVITGS